MRFDKFRTLGCSLCCPDRFLDPRAWFSDVRHQGAVVVAVAAVAAVVAVAVVAVAVVAGAVVVPAAVVVAVVVADVLL